MRALSALFAAALLLLGLFFAVGSYSMPHTAGTHAAILGCFCLLFVIALGVWQDHSKTDELEKYRKQIIYMNDIQIELLKKIANVPNHDRFMSQGQVPPGQIPAPPPR